MARAFFLFYLCCERVIAALPIAPVYAVGRALGLACYYLAGSYRALVLRNMQIAFGTEKTAFEIRALAREHFATLGANLLCSIKVSTMTPAEIATRVDVEDLDGLFSHCREGRGVVLVICHMGNWELLSQLAPFAPQGHRVGAIYQPLGNRYLDAHIKKIRARFGITPFDRGGGFTASIQLLREAGMVGVLVDQHAGDGGVWSPLFGRLASTSPLAATLVSRTGAALVPVTVATVGRARWKLVVLPILTEIYKNSEELTAAINQAVEAEIRVSPRDWFWVHHRWKTPRPSFLLAHYKRGVTLPAAFPPERLKPFRILVRSSNWLGDAVMSAPAVRAIAAGRPDARITVLTPAKLADFWKTMPEVAEIIAIQPGESVFAVARKIRQDFEAGFIFPNSPRSALEMFLAGIPRRVGYRRPWRGPLVNQVVPDPAVGRPPRHEVHHYLQMAGQAGADIAGADEVFPALPALEGGGWLGLCPGAEYGLAKRWMPERFAEVARQVSERTGRKWLLFGVEKDRAIGEEIAGKLGGEACRNLIGKTSLAELIEHLRQCRLLLTNDTGTMHLADHLGVPVVAVFGSTEPALTGPRGPRARVIRHRVACSPCFLRECPLDFRCMEAVTVEETVQAVLQELLR